MESSQILTIAAVQADSLWEQSEQNIARAVEHISTVEAELVIFPEMFATGFSMDSARIAQYPDGQIVSAMRDAALKYGKALIFSAATRHNDQFYNRLYFIHPTGEIESYDKRHLFRMAGEDDHYAAGGNRLIVNYKGWRICPLICYDLRFAVYSRGADDYDLLIYIASWPAVRSYAWSTLLCARAIENQSFCVGVNRVGSDPKNQYSGHSVILDYMGRPMVSATPSKEEVITAEISLDELRKFRASFPAHLDADNFKITL